ncbi:hypothetical protein RFF05_13295 [Bengtsoniella intestinalis]|uniref:hypothetical protein n=1 Tax=Bengtsoniella intestinalis TaxID=3073143 RepID=UPI00391FAA4A
MKQRLLPTFTLLLTAVLSLAILLPASASDRELPIYSVDTAQKVCAISFDAAWADGWVR